MDYNFNINFPDEDRALHLFNDEKSSEIPHRRVHMIYLSCVAIAKSSESILQTEARKWRGERNIAYAKGKKKYTYIGRENFCQHFSDHIIDSKTGTFKGLDSIPKEGEPLAQYKLWPICGFDRTLFA